MTDLTPNLDLPYLVAAQSQKHVTHNEALRTLDAVVQLSVLDRDLAAPPPSPANGARYIVAASPSGAWTGQSGKVAAYQDNAWKYLVPREGWLAWIADENLLLAHDGTTWIAASSGSGGGEANTAANVNAGGVGVFKQKTGVNLEFRGINAGSGTSAAPSTSAGRRPPAHSQRPASPR
jgi:hypothetical protein